MEKMKCDIIQDLIPSYVDKICSEATRQCVEEHIKSCKECQQMVVLSRDHVATGEKLEQKELDGLKKIKQIGQLKGVVCCGLMIFLMVCLGLNLFVVQKNVLSYSAHTVMLIACMVLVLLSGMGYTRRVASHGKGMAARGKEAADNRENLQEGKTSRMPEWVMSIVSCSICAYIFILSMGLARTILDGKTSFWGREMERVGPFIDGQIILGFVMCMVFLLYVLFRILKYGKEGNWLLCLLVTDSFLLFQYALFLRAMDSPYTIILSLIYITVETLFIGALGIVCSMLVANYFKKKAHSI